MLWIRSPLNWEHHQPCVRGEAWQWQGLRFSAHWPLQGSNDKGNNHSCVVKIDDGTNSILLTGDIEAPLNKDAKPLLAANAGNITSGTSPWQ